MSAQISARKDFVRRFHGALRDSRRFRIKFDNPFGQRIAGPRLSFELTWERYPEEDDVPIILLYSAWRPALKMHLWLLRVMFGSRPGPSSPEFLAQIVNDEFADFLAGDFKRRKLYIALEDKVLDKITDVKELPVDHPTRVKFENFDAAWLDEI